MMKNPFVNYFEQFTGLSEETRKVITESFYIKDFPKNHKLISVGEKVYNFYYIFKGSIRGYYLNNETEVTHTIAFENETIAPFYSYYMDTESSLIYQTMEESSLAVFNLRLIEKDMETNIELSQLAYKLISIRSVVFEERLFDIQCNPARIRLKKLLFKNQDILSRIPLSYIASFLGITRKTLHKIISENV